MVFAVTGEVCDIAPEPDDGALPIGPDWRKDDPLIGLSVCWFQFRVNGPLALRDGGEVADVHVGLGEVDLEAGFGEPLVLTTVDVVLLAVFQEGRVAVVERAETEAVDVNDQTVLDEVRLKVEEWVGLEVQRAPWRDPGDDVVTVDLLHGEVLVQGGS